MYIYSHSFSFFVTTMDIYIVYYICGILPDLKQLCLSIYAVTSLWQILNCNLTMNILILSDLCYFIDYVLDALCCLTSGNTIHFYTRHCVLLQKIVFF